MRFVTSILTVACFCAWLEAAPARVAAQAPSVVAPQQAGGCHEVKKRGKGKPDPACYTYVFDAVQASPTLPPPVDACKIDGFWSWLKCNATSVSAVASSLSAISAIVIGFVVIRLNQNIRKGQVAHEQMRMLLEIDGELVARPELWAVHGTTYLPKPFPSKDIDKMVEDFKNPTTDAATKAGIADKLFANPDATELIKLRQLAFTTRYFNFFEILFANYGKKMFWRRFRQNHSSPPTKKFKIQLFEKFWRRLTEGNEEWRAWRAYIVDFFQNNENAKDEWKKFAMKHIYSASFEEFMVEIVPEAKPPSIPIA